MKVDIISGFLGSGKTTFINRYLPLLDGKLALIENEFGDNSIDTGLIEDDLPIEEIFAGCICCTLKGDFSLAIKKIYDLYQADRIIIEPSGVGRLSDVAKGIEDAGKITGMDLEISRLIVMVDVDTFEDYSQNFGPFFLDQIENAKAIFLTNLDEVKEEDLAGIISKLREINPSAIIVSSDYRKMDDQGIKDILEAIETTSYPDKESTRAIPGDKVFSSFSIDSGNLNREGIEKALKDLEDKDYGYLLRAKGYFTDEGRKLINYTPSKANIEEASQEKDNKLVIIGTDLDEEKIRKVFAKYREG